MSGADTLPPVSSRVPLSRSARLRRARARYRRWRFCRPALMRFMTWLIVAAAVNFTATARVHAQTPGSETAPAAER